ncbi:hypothetical protein AMTR_s00003p00267620 [Amborella trichopoda]|uniref:K+ potassium transporter integral membrane domain-containing protein n=1 Tax=Amborella trichopoda TaxID=13333 RepID=W1P6C0_AMBTC|nr:hypothetical protein AMTR_s00003p00267620 [Amborella trichopoda]
MNSNCLLSPSLSMPPPNLCRKGGVSDKEPREHKLHLLQLRAVPYVLAHNYDSDSGGHSGEPSPDIYQLFYPKAIHGFGVLPTYNMLHTSSKHERQVYSPEVNYLRIVIYILIVVGFKGGV